MKDIGLTASGTDGNGSGDRKVRAKTLQERMGFVDHELTTPLHDEIVLWLDANAEGVVTELAQRTGWSKRSVSEGEKEAKGAVLGRLQEACAHNLRQWLGDQAYDWGDAPYGEARRRKLEDVLDDDLFSALDLAAELQETHTLWVDTDTANTAAVYWAPKPYRTKPFDPARVREHAAVLIHLLSGIVPFPPFWTDLGFETKPFRDVAPLIGWKGLGAPPPVPDCDVRAKKWEQPVLDRTFTVGFLDMLVSAKWPSLSVSMEAALPAWRVDFCEEDIAFEVKTSIPSIGELVRQIRLYQTYLRDPRVVVVAPDDRWAEALRGQGIEFVRYPGADGR